ncbi:MAG: hypothetical protein NVSMB24_19600 [Mucilaginibacter sp.]
MCCWFPLKHRWTEPSNLSGRWNNQHAQAAVFSEIGRLIEAILLGQKNREILKAQFTSILDGYIKSREAFTMMTSGREKEELVAVTKEQVRLL